jgi:hypothetical protein
MSSLLQMMRDWEDTGVASEVMNRRFAGEVFLWCLFVLGTIALVFVLGRYALKAFMRVPTEAAGEALRTVFLAVGAVGIGGYLAYLTGLAIKHNPFVSPRRHEDEVTSKPIRTCLNCQHFRRVRAYEDTMHGLWGSQTLVPDEQLPCSVPGNTREVWTAHFSSPPRPNRAMYPRDCPVWADSGRMRPAFRTPVWQVLLGLLVMVGLVGAILLYGRVARWLEENTVLPALAGLLRAAATIVMFLAAGAGGAVAWIRRRRRGPPHGR